MYTITTTQAIKLISKKSFGIFAVLLSTFVCFFLVLPLTAAAQVAQGDGQYFYGIQSDTMPYSKAYVNSSNTFSATSTTVASGTAVVSVIKASPERNELVAGYVTASGVLNVVCYDGATWTNEWSINVGGTGTTRRFDIGYETDTGDVMVLYSGNATTTNELRYQTKSGASGCGTGNWSGATNLDPVRSTGTVQWIKIAEDKRATSTLMTAIWADSNSDLSSMVWSGSAWGNEHSAALETALEVISAAQDTESFDVAYESTSGDVMVSWGSGGTDGTNGAYYALCTGGTSSCTWGSVRTAMPTFLDDASHISIKADPLSDQIVFASVGNAGGDMQYGIWSGSAWTNTANADNSSAAVTAGRMFVATGWLNNAGLKRAVVAYYDSAATNIGWRTASGTTWTTQTDVTPTTAFGTQTQYKIEINPFNQSEVLFIASNSIRRGFAKRLAMTSGGVFSWTDSDGGVLAGGLGSDIYRAMDFAYLRYVPPSTLSGVLYSDAGITNAGSGKSIKVAVGTSTPSVHTVTTTSGGVWEFDSSVFTSATSGTPFAIWLDGAADDATTLMAGYSGLSVMNVPLYYDHVIVYGATTASQVNAAAFGFYSSSDDADILYFYDTYAGGFSLDVDGNFLISRGEFISGPSLSVTEDFINRGTFNANTGAVALMGSGVVDGILTGTSSFSTLNVDNSSSYSIATTSASTTNLFIGSGSSLTASQNVSVAGNYLNEGTFTHNNGTLYIGSTFGGFLGAVDVTGNNSGGTGAVNANSVLKHGNYLFVATNGDGTACSQTPSAIGCEIQVYDITDPVTPIYLAGRDSGGSPTGPRVEGVASLAVKDNTLYVGKETSSDDCNPVVGSAQGCELIIFDISDPTNPTFVAALDDDGSVSGDEMNLFLTLEIEGNYLYTTKYNSGNACSQTPGSAEGCELQVFDISSSTNPVYVAGRDVDGSTNGTGYQTVWGSTIAGDYWFITTSGAASACSQTPGSAVGCELQIYDISTRTNPTYIAGMDASAVADGDTGNIFFDVAVSESGNTLYVAAAGAEFDCDTNNYSCELHVYNITNPATPTFITGRDASGVFVDNEIGAFVNVHVEGNYLYVFKLGDAAVCSQIAGSAKGCEIQVYDISSTTNPIYVAGRDADGTLTGTDNRSATSGYVVDGYLFAAMAASSTACTAGVDAGGCEILTFQTAAIMDGVMTGNSALSGVTIAGSGVVFEGNASTTNLTIKSGTLTAPAILSVGSTFTNNAAFDAHGGEVLLFGTGHTLVGTTTFFDLTKNATTTATTTFQAGSLTTVEGEWNFSGVSTGARHALRSSTPSSYWYVNSATNTLSNLDVRDSNNLNVSTIVCDTGCIDSTNNVNWTLTPAEAIGFYSVDPSHFYLGQATTTLGAIVITDLTVPTVTAANDIRISIATTTTNFRFNTGTTNLSFSGTAAGKVSSTVSYADGGATLVVNVTSDFASLDTLLLTGVAVGSFASVSTTTSNFALHTDGNSSGAPAASDSETIRITGNLSLSDHTDGQVDNEFSAQNKSDAPLFAFNLTGVSEAMTVSDLVVTLSGVQGLDSSNLSDFKLYRDNDDDGVLDGGDTLIDGGGILTLNGQVGAVTFSTDFIATTSANYLVTADTTSIQLGESAVFSLPELGLTALGATSLYVPVVLTTVDTIQHFRNNGGGGGGNSARVGDTAPAGAGVVSGGETGGGGETGDEVDGENIAGDIDFSRPNSTGDIYNEWTNGGNALLSDGTYATAASTNLRQSYNGFAFNIPGSNTIEGIAVKLDASGSTAAGTIDVSLSWDGGASYTTAKATPTLSGTDIVYSVGSASDLWGRSWTPSQFTPENFRLRVSAQPSSNTIRLDALEVRVYHQAGGGSSGGGGGI